MKTYQTIYILPPQFTDNELEGQVDKAREFLYSFGASSIKLKSKGRCKFQTPIKKHKLGTFIELTYLLKENKVNELIKQFKLNETLLRTFTLRNS
uniref:Ribosomal protein S6 n=1 Tax=Gloeochaete wittrockiana TaxID=38269 RepID=A0A3G1IVQ9_9EUKA|nr:ribosomal protein S6 [Gloeochaete wittrockiana]ASQ40146.1 ribosomal protein S6 [Gloeochaete wittrockiana]